MSIFISSQGKDKRLVCTGLCVHGPAGKDYQQTPCLNSSFHSLRPNFNGYYLNSIILSVWQLTLVFAS